MAKQLYTLDLEFIRRLESVVETVERIPINQLSALLRRDPRPPRDDTGVTMYSCQLTAALATTDTEISVDNLGFMGGANIITDSSVTAKNRLKYAGKDDGYGVIVWHESNSEWVLLLTECA